MVVLWWALERFGITGVAAAGSGFITISSFEGNLVEYRILTAPATAQATATDLGAGDQGWTMLGAAFRGP